MESRTTLYGPMLAIIALSFLAIYDIPAPTETPEEEATPTSSWPQRLRDRAIAFTSGR